jgi:hypothetical protein
LTSVRSSTVGEPPRFVADGSTTARGTGLRGDLRVVVKLPTLAPSKHRLDHVLDRIDAHVLHGSTSTSPPFIYPGTTERRRNARHVAGPMRRSNAVRTLGTHKSRGSRRWSSGRRQSQVRGSGLCADLPHLRASRSPREGWLSGHRLSPSQPRSVASRSRSLRLTMTAKSRGSGRRIGHLMQAKVVDTEGAVSRAAA